MNFNSFYSIMTSIVFLNIFLILFFSIKKTKKFIILFRTQTLLLISILFILRLILHIEFRNSIIIRSKLILPTLINIFKTPIINTIEFNLMELLLLIWAIGIIITSMKSIRLQWYVKQYLKKANKESYYDDISLLEKILKKYNCKKNINVYRSEDIKSPIVNGLFKYEIYLPVIYIPEEKLEYVLNHEVNHILGKDQFKKLGLEIFRILFWWNPIINKFIEQLQEVIEIECDKRTVKIMNYNEKMKYLESLLYVIKETKDIKENNTLYGLAFFNSNCNETKQRFDMVLNDIDNNPKLTTIRAAFCLIITLIFISSYFINAKPYYELEDSGYYIKEEDEIILKKNNEKIIFD